MKTENTQQTRFAIVITMIVLILFMLAASLFSQCKPKPMFFDPAPVENYVTGGMILTTFLVVDYSDRYFYRTYGDTLLRDQQRNLVVATCFVTTVVTHIAIRQIRKHLRR